MLEFLFLKIIRRRGHQKQPEAAVDMVQVVKRKAVERHARRFEIEQHHAEFRAGGGVMENHQVCGERRVEEQFQTFRRHHARAVARLGVF